jgi:CHAT domain-containing protein/tetratricopeptide (TPR) repeat protein
MRRGRSLLRSTAILAVLAAAGLANAREDLQAPPLSPGTGNVPSHAGLAPESLTSDERARLKGQAKDFLEQAHRSYQSGDLAEAQERLLRSLRILERLYPEGEFPRGHLDLANGLNNLGELLRVRGEYDQALDTLERARAMFERLFPRDEYPDGHPDLAICLSNLGLVHHAQGDYVRADDSYGRARAMFERLFPKDEYPDGHPTLASLLNNLGGLAKDQGEYTRALTYYRESLAMRERLFPKDRYSLGHPSVAMSLNNTGVLLDIMGEYDGAEESHRRALEMRQRLYPQVKYPRGHPDLVLSLSNLGEVLSARGELVWAEENLRHALAICEKLYPEREYPSGHPATATVLGNLGMALLARGHSDEAATYTQRAASMWRSLYPSDAYPQGHPKLAISFIHTGRVLHAQGDHARAADQFRQALAMILDLSASFYAAAAAAESLNFAATLPLARDLLLSTARRDPGSDSSLYASLWHAKAAVSRTVERRQRALVRTSGPETRALGDELFRVRHELARLMLSPDSPGATTLPRLRALTGRKEYLERRLAGRLPAYDRQALLAHRPPTDLGKKLPRDGALIDLILYHDDQPNPAVPRPAGERITPSYVAFVLGPEGPVQRVDLGAAGPIDKAIEAWREDLMTQRHGGAAQDLRRLVWEPLERRLPARTAEVWMSPDGALSRLPWAALPGRKPGTFLLEDYALALAPHGLFLLDRLTADPEPEASKALLIVGDVPYGRRKSSAPSADRLTPHRAPTGRGEPTWAELPWTRREITAVAALARGSPTIWLTGEDASPGRVVAALPKVRRAHLATHGFFADPHYRSSLQLDESIFVRNGDRAAPGSRNPLTLSGLVFAMGEILTAEEISGLPLQNLELVMLTACKTGLGEIAGGEGVFGLQRAFHTAGASSVVASLWQVDDETTQKLMETFYRNLADGKGSKAEALRRAQIEMLREGLGDGPHPYYWAGWVISGDPVAR